MTEDIFWVKDYRFYDRVDAFKYARQHNIKEINHITIFLLGGEIEDVWYETIYLK